MYQRWLVTGGAGYIGSHVANLVKKSNIEVLVIDDLSTGFTKNIDPGVEFIELSLLDSNFSQVFKKWAPTTVIHCAGIKYASLSESDPLLFYERNTVTSLALAKAIRLSRVQNLIFSSSCSVYGNPSSSPVTELTPLTPISPYGKSKLAAEVLLRDFSKISQTNFAAIRYFNVVGNEPGMQDQSLFNLFPILKRVFVENRDFHIYGHDLKTKDGTPVRDYVDVRDVATAHIMVALQMNSTNRSIDPVNLSNGQGHTVLEIFKEFAKYFPNWTGTLKYEEMRPGDPVSIFGSSELLNSNTGWVPRFNLSSTISSVIGSEMNIVSHDH